MASSYFEVKETSNDENVLPFDLECDVNGIALASQLEGDLPKDHTYTKEPDILQIVEEDSNDAEAVETHKPVERAGRSQRNVKPHKFIKSTREGKTKKAASPVKKDAAAKSPKKVATKQIKGKKNLLNNKKEELSPSEQNADGAPKVENGVTEDLPEQSRSKRKGTNKRKLEEKENIVDDCPPSSDVALIEGNTPDEVIDDVEEIKKPSKKAKTSASSGKRKIAKKEKTETTKKVAKISSGSKGNPTSTIKGLPTGWIRKDVVRKSGKTAGHIDVYIYSPDGLKFRSKPDVAAYLARTKSNLKLENFNFSKTTVAKVLAKPTNPHPMKKDKSPPVKSKEKNIIDKKAAGNVPVRKGQKKLVVKLKFASPSKRDSKSSRITSMQSNSKKSKPKSSVNASASGKKGNKKKKTA